jgi:nucleotide-binding universal stress UspA family protein
MSMKLLVPVDGSTAAQRAVAYALWLVHGRPEAMIVLLNVQNQETLGLSDIDVRTEDECKIASSQSTKVLRSAIKACKGAGVRFEARAEFGPICKTIERIAHEVHPDQIVMGTRGLGRLTGLVLGSVATGVIHMARVPVTLVKRNMRSQSSGLSPHEQGTIRTPR